MIPAVEWAWRPQSIWSQTVDKLKAGPHRLWGLGLGLTVAAAALALAGSQVKTVSVPASVALAVAGALALATVGLFRGWRDGRGPQARAWWTKAAQAGDKRAQMRLYQFRGG